THAIAALRGSFHGRLFGSLAAPDRPAYQEPFTPLMPGVRFIPPGDEAVAREAITLERTAAVIVEPVQGEGGVRPLDPEYLRFLRALTNEAGAALIFDEVQCGLGRTGRLFAHEEAGVTPDIMTLAKPLAGGLPMGAVLVSGRIAEAIRPGDHATTFGGGPLVSSVALAVVRRIAEPAFLEAVRKRGERVREVLEPRAGRGRIVDVRGRGRAGGCRRRGRGGRRVRGWATGAGGDGSLWAAGQRARASRAMTSCAVRAVTRGSREVAGGPGGGWNTSSAGAATVKGRLGS